MPSLPFEAHPVIQGLVPEKTCSVCAARSCSKRCGGCRVVAYCTSDHQKTHWPKHKSACDAIKTARQVLEKEEALLRAYSGECIASAGEETIDLFTHEDAVGRFSDMFDTGDYMRARFRVADSLLQISTEEAVCKALAHFQDMLRLGRSDALGVRHWVPHLLLRLGREQECYDYLKWWTTSYNEEDECYDTSLPYLDIHGADVFEPISTFRPSAASLGQLSALALLKTRLYLDFVAFEDPDDYMGINLPLELDPVFDRQVGRIAQEAIQHLTSLDAAARAEHLLKQIREICKIVHEDNPYFWDTLIDEGPCVPPHYYSYRSEEHARYVVSFSQKAWNESDNALRTVECEVADLVPVYEGRGSGNAAAAVGMPMPFQTTAPRELQRGSGVVFPSRFVPPQPSSSPTALFPCTPGAGPVSRFVRYDNREMALVFTDGSCHNNGGSNPRAGWAVVAGQPPAVEGKQEGSLSIASGRLENRGPFGDESEPTSNRAELRAVIAALRMADWRQEGYTSIVIATDSSYAVDGATSWARSWVRNDWMTRTYNAVKNRDLWELLLGQVEQWSKRGLEVQLWKIPREQNMRADLAANTAVAKLDEPVFRDVEEGKEDDDDDDDDDGNDDASMVDDRVVNNNSSNRKGVLMLSIDQNGWAEKVYEDLVASVTARASSLQRSTDPEEALAMLDETPPPATILILDAGPARQLRVWKRVIDHLRAGTTVVLAGGFSTSVTSGQFERVFRRLGLPWKRASYTRDTVRLQREAVGRPLGDSLAAAYYPKATFARNVDPSAVWYAASEAPDQAAVVFAKVGQGRLGYIGDVNGEKESIQAVLAMCGLLR
ncbi:Ribonuclease H-like protein [Niveomyces insectorum RCEF 264]|uniref:ribonuclease H n=1 Tax=Niveomyces insectorum RCEF 264 TaxID=1081102 RepID=A0A167PU33_9HYPO|nr:Ribonuclease H-like protein [Niveomyces insectorum RCEF 264]